MIRRRGGVRFNIRGVGIGGMGVQLPGTGRGRFGEPELLGQFRVTVPGGCAWPLIRRAGAARCAPTRTRPDHFMFVCRCHLLALVAEIPLPAGYLPLGVTGQLYMGVGKPEPLPPMVLGFTARTAPPLRTEQ